MIIFDAKHASEIEAEIDALAAPLRNAIGNGFFVLDRITEICIKYVNEDEADQKDDQKARYYMVGANIAYLSTAYEDYMVKHCPYTMLIESPRGSVNELIGQIVSDNQLRGLVGAAFELQQEDEDGTWMVRIFASDPETLVIIKLAL